MGCGPVLEFSGLKKLSVGLLDKILSISVCFRMMGETVKFTDQVE